MQKNKLISHNIIKKNPSFFAFLFCCFYSPIAIQIKSKHKHNIFTKILFDNDATIAFIIANTKYFKNVALWQNPNFKWL